MSKYIWALIEICSTVVFQFIAVVILSRLLSPADYGVIGVMTIFIAISSMIVDSGMGSAIIKKNNVSNIDYDTLFIFNISISVILYLIIFTIAPILESFYGISDLSSYLRILGLIIIISALGVVQNAKLYKELKYRTICLISFISNLISLSIAIMLARTGQGVMALIWQQLIFMTLRVILQSTYNKYIPKFRFSKESFKYQFKFGINIMISNLLNVFYLNFVSSIIPKIASPVENGYYVQANKIQNVPVSIVTSLSDKALFPILSKCKCATDLKDKGRNVVKYSFLLILPVLVICSEFSQEIINLLLGSKWDAAAPVLKILFYTGAGICYQYYGKNILKAMGKTTIILKLEIVKTTVGLAVLGICLIGGLTSLLYGLVASSVVTAIITMFYLNKHVGYTWIEQLDDLKYSIIISSVLFLLIHTLL